MMMPPSKTIPCRRCGVVGETHKIWVGWYCVVCLGEIDKAFETGSGVKAIKETKKRDTP